MVGRIPCGRLRGRKGDPALTYVRASSNGFGFIVPPATNPHSPGVNAEDPCRTWKHAPDRHPKRRDAESCPGPSRAIAASAQDRVLDPFPEYSTLLLNFGKQVEVAVRNNSSAGLIGECAALVSIGDQMILIWPGRSVRDASMPGAQSGRFEAPFMSV